jgi:hypothetical protein
MDAEHAAENVGGSPSGKWNDDAYRSAWETLRMSGRRKRTEAKGQNQQQRFLHDALLLLATCHFESARKIKIIRS